MTTVQMNADVYRSLSIIAEDSDLMKKAMIYLRKLARQKQEDDALMTKEEFLSMIDKRMENYEKGEFVSFSSPEEPAHIPDSVLGSSVSFPGFLKKLPSQLCEV